MHRGCFLPAAALVAAALVPVVARGSQQHVLDVRVSVGNDAGNGAFAARALALSADGVSAAFSTSEPLVASDVDGLEDLYLRSGGQTYLLTPGAALGGAPEFEPGSVRGLPDGRVLFGSHNDISDPMPDDATVDYFVASSAGVVTLLTAGSSNDAKDPAVSPGGAYFAYSVGNDTYRVPTAGGMPEVVTVSGATGTPVAVSDTGAVLVATTDSGGGDTDTATDLRRFAAPSVMGTLVTPGTSNTPVTYLGGSADLGVVAFATLEGLPDTNADANGATDAYEIAGAAAGGALRRLSRPGAGVVGVSGAPGVESAPCVAGGGDAILVSTDRLAAGDADSIADVYRVPVTGDPVLLSGGDSSGPAVPFATADCSRLVVSTMTPLAAGSNGTPAQYVITGTTAALAGNSSTFFGATPDGASVLINSDTRLTAEDENSVSDAYVFTGGVRRLVTRGGPLSAGETGAAASADG
ncbi:MAG: hypothetical protein QOF76_1160, partial [Solirubrobacteraceae bacterium]|nr:hypothetical protein [Solirubrobacteraceae bacterium]